MSSLYTNGPARRLLLCSVCRGLELPFVVSTGRTGYLSSCEAQGKRHYATKRINPIVRTANPPSPRFTAPPSSPASSRAPRALADDNRSSNSQPARFIFSAQDIPPLKEWVHLLEGLGAKHLTPLQCVDAARRYVSIATQYETQWRPKLEKEHDLSPFMLHWLGILLLAGNTAALWRLGTHMLRSASELGYVPSTLSLVRTFRSIPPHMFAQAAKSIMYRDANARFQEIVKAGTDPNALTLQGIIHAKSADKGSDLKALAAFRQATMVWQKRHRKEGSVAMATEAVVPDKGIQASAATLTGVTNNDAVDATAGRQFTLPPPREPRWDWEVSCILGQANILAKDPGSTEEALKLYRVAALELDNPHAFFMLANLMREPLDTPERRVYLLKAATSGDPEACRELGELEALAAKRHGLSQKERAEHSMLSKEWLRLADGEDVSAFIKANIGDQEAAQ